MLPVKAKFGLKKNYFSIVQNGYFFVEITPVIENHESANDLKWNWQQKKSIVIEPKNMLKLTKYNQKNFHKLNLNIPGIKIDKSNGQNDVSKLNFKYSEVTDTIECIIDLKNSNEPSLELAVIKIEPSEFFMMQQMIDYSIPAVVGWQFLYKGVVEQSESKIDTEYFENRDNYQK